MSGIRKCRCQDSLSEEIRTHDMRNKILAALMFDDPVNRLEQVVDHNFLLNFL